MDINYFIQEIELIDWLKHANHICNIIENENDWEWLPTSRDQEDPFCAYSQAVNDNEVNKEINKAYKATLKSLRTIGSRHPKLQNGPHDYTESFKGAALFAIRYAAYEYLSNTHGKWMEVFGLYKKGRWPCGLEKNGTIVVL